MTHIAADIVAEAEFLGSFDRIELIREQHQNSHKTDPNYENIELHRMQFYHETVPAVTMVGRETSYTFIERLIPVLSAQSPRKIKDKQRFGRRRPRRVSSGTGTFQNQWPNPFSFR